MPSFTMDKLQPIVYGNYGWHLSCKTPGSWVGPLSRGSAKVSSQKREFFLAPVAFGCLVLTSGYCHRNTTNLYSSGFMLKVEQWWFWQTSPKGLWLYVPSGIREVLQDPAVLTCVTTVLHQHGTKKDKFHWCVTHFTKYECKPRKQPQPWPLKLKQPITHHSNLWWRLRLETRYYYKQRCLILVMKVYGFSSENVFFDFMWGLNPQKGGVMSEKS